MLKIAEIQTLRIKDINSEGALLMSASGNETVMLSASLVPLNKNTGDEIQVFVFTDNYGKPVATIKKPKLLAGQIGMLKVIDYNDKGAFLDWEFVVDVFAPSDNIQFELKKGNSYLFRLFVNNKRKIRATTDIYGFLSAKTPFGKDDQIQGVVYKKLKEAGYLVAVENKYFGLIPATECFQQLELGELIQGRVIRVREDGKLDISLRQVAHIQLELDAELILDKMRSSGGKLFLTDNSHPDEIKKRLNLSKKAFKRAVGRLLKNGAISQSNDSIIVKR